MNEQKSVPITLHTRSSEAMVCGISWFVPRVYKILYDEPVLQGTQVLKHLEVVENTDAEASQVRLAKFLGARMPEILARH